MSNLNYIINKIGNVCPVCRCNSLKEFTLLSKSRLCGVMEWKHFHCLVCSITFGLREVNSKVEVGYDDYRVIEDLKELLKND